jgi:hypothetical protein
MPNISTYFQNSELAFAAYAQNLATTADRIGALKAAGMTQLQAEKFDQSWQVLAQQDLTDGFSIDNSSIRKSNATGLV